jgi:uncharacterized protein
MGESVNRPAMPSERIVALDVIRGFAMFGVLIAYCMWSLGTLPAEAYTPLDNALENIVAFAVDSKFYTILAFLFGLGFQLQLSRSDAADPDIVRLYRRRLLVLALIGLVHALLLRNGDILLPYALTGFLLIPFRCASDRTILVAALLILLVPFGARLLWQASGVAMPERPDLAGAGYLTENFAWVRYWYATAILNWPGNLTLFLFGFYAGRHALVSKVTADPVVARRILAAGLVGAAGFLFLRARIGAGVPDAGPSAIQGLAISLLFSFHAWSLAVAYMAMLLLAGRTRSGASFLRPLASVGRMALTNYLMQALMLVPICLAFGLFDRFTPTIALTLAIAIFVLIQMPLSHFWLSRFDFGPAEWLWRWLTYGRVPTSEKATAEPAL